MPVLVSGDLRDIVKAGVSNFNVVNESASTKLGGYKDISLHCTYMYVSIKLYCIALQGSPIAVEI